MSGVVLELLDKHIAMYEKQRKHWDDCLENLPEPKYESVGFNAIIGSIDTLNAKIEALEALKEYL